MASFVPLSHPTLPWGTAALATLLLAGCYSGPPASAGDATATDSDGDATAATAGAGTGTAPTDTADDASNATDEGDSSGGEDVEPAPTYPIRRLTSRELDKTLRAALELDPTFSDYFLPLEPDEPLQVFSNEVAGLVVGAGVLEAQLEIMERFSNRMAAQNSTSPRAFTDCEAISERACLEAFVQLVGGRLFRRPVTEEHAEQLLAVYDDVLVESDADVAYSALVLAMVLSPRTLYLLAETEDQRSWAVAERLSFFLWGAGPDDELRGLAADDSILDPEVLHAQATRLLADNRARDNLGLFYFELLDLTRFEHYFKGFQYESDIGLSRSVIQEDFIDAAFAPYSQAGTLESLLTEPLSFSDPAFAENYPGDYPGLLSHPAFTWTHAANRSTHPVGRGVTVRERLLCQNLGAPPMDISAIPDNVDE
ncbi:MAG: DUF1592 domain-containing protein, partial [Nannocystaceae bacterium]|nr:DUF1592 domain-containing protein [Nannocystaceae bacterium]